MSPIALHDGHSSQGAISIFSPYYWSETCSNDIAQVWEPPPSLVEIHSCTKHAFKKLVVHFKRTTLLLELCLPQSSDKTSIRHAVLVTCPSHHNGGFTFSPLRLFSGWKLRCGSLFQVCYLWRQYAKKHLIWSKSLQTSPPTQLWLENHISHIEYALILKTEVRLL